MEHPRPHLNEAKPRPQRHNYKRPPNPESLVSDMMRLAEAMLGPQFGEDSQERWHTKPDAISASGEAVFTDDGENYFIYGESTILPHGVKVAYRGLKRVIFSDKVQDGGKQIIFSISTQAYHEPQQELFPRSSNYHHPLPKD